MKLLKSHQNLEITKIEQSYSLSLSFSPSGCVYKNIQLSFSLIVSLDTVMFHLTPTLLSFLDFLTLVFLHFWIIIFITNNASKGAPPAGTPRAIQPITKEIPHKTTPPHCRPRGQPAGTARGGATSM